MRFKPCLMLALPIVASLSLASGCATRERVTPIFPSSADLRVEPKPQLRPEDLASEAALDRYDIAVEAWGEAGWKTVARICRWAEGNGAAVECPP